MTVITIEKALSKSEIDLNPLQGVMTVITLTTSTLTNCPLSLIPYREL